MWQTYREMDQVIVTSVAIDKIGLSDATLKSRSQVVQF